MNDEDLDDDVQQALHDASVHGFVHATCPECKDERTVEPDAEDYDCHTPHCPGRITSPLRRAGLI